MEGVQSFKAADYLQIDKNITSKGVTFPKEAEIVQADESDKQEGFSGLQVGGAVLATALSAAALAGGIIYKKSVEIKIITEQLSELRAKLVKIIDEMPGSKSITELAAELKSMLKTKKIGYDVMKPPIDKTRNPGGTGVAEELKMVFPEAMSPIKPLKAPDFKIPEIGRDGSFDVKLPSSGSMKVAKCETMNFEPQRNIQTGISSNYADSVVWDNDKIARDVLQNFYDGHGQTLDGVQMVFEPVAGGKYRVKIVGQSTYSSDKAALIGESTKRGDANAAGNYGEGLKMAALKLLRDKGAQNVRVGSSNWELSYRLAQSSISTQKVLTYDLAKTPVLNGNFIEFETTDRTLLDSLRKSINHFKHSNNPHFTSMAFENDIVAMRVLPNVTDKGGIYIAGQRFEFNDNYDGLPGAIISIKQKPPKDILDPSRDRISLNDSQLSTLATWISGRSTREEKFEILKILEPFFPAKSSFTQGPMDTFLNTFVRNIGYTFRPGNLAGRVKFPEKYVASSPASQDVINLLKQQGYIICDSNFSKLGMKSMHDVMCGASAHAVLKPNQIQEKKILLIKEALSRILPKLEKKHFTEAEIDAKIYMFDRNSPKESSMNSDTLAEAITEYGESKGFWIDKNYLDTAKFSDVLETALHELCHKVGGDESAAFSYKLTDVNRDVIFHLLRNNKTREYIQAINKVWEDLASTVA